MKKRKRDRAFELLARGAAHKSAGRLQQAHSCCAEAARILAVILSSGGETPEALSDLRISLQRLGDVEHELGQLDAAYERFEQVHKSFRRALPVAGQTPQSMSNLSLILGRMGDVEQDRGDLDEAYARFTQSYEIAQTALELGGETIDALRGVGICLERLGNVERTRGSPDAAYTRYEQMIEINRKVLALAGETPEALRSLIVSLNCLGDVECKRGSLDAAYTRFTQMHETAQKVLALSGETPDALRGLRLSLEQLGDVELARNRPDAAYTCFEQALEIARRVQMVVGTKPQALHDLSLSLGRVGDVERALGDLDAAFERFEQKLEVDRKALALTGDAPVALRELSFSLSLLGAVEYQRDHFDTAREYFSQAYETARKVLELAGETPQVLNDLSACLLDLGKVERLQGQTAWAVGRLDEALRLLPRISSQLAFWPLYALSWSTYIADLVEAASVSVEQALAHRATLWRCVLEHLEFAETEALEGARLDVAEFHALWLRLALQRAPERVPEVLAAMQGRKIAAMVLDELEQQPASSGPDAELRQRYLALRQRLRRLALGLQLLDTGRDDPDHAGHRGRIESGRGGASWPDVVRARQAEHDAALAEFRRVRTELSRRPGFEAFAPQIELGGLQPSLGADQAVILLVHTPREAQSSSGGAQGKLAAAYALVLRSESQILLPVAELARSPGRLQGAALTMSRRAGVRYVAGPAESSMQTAADALAEAAEPLPEHLAHALWRPLTEHLQGVRVLHVVTHGDLHVLPLQALAPPAMQVRLYPGLVFYWLQHLGAQRAVPVPERATAMQVYSPGPGEYPPPIPFVHAEARLLSSLWDKVHEPLLLAEPRVLAIVHLAGHGDAAAGPNASLLIGPGQRLGLHEVLGARLQATIVYLSACLVGRTSEDLDGDPLGMVSGFFLRGARCVVAPLVPISDFYAPLLAALFYHALAQQRSSDQPLDAHAALGHAKSHLQDGRWPQAVIDGVRSAYETVLAPQLAQVLAALDVHDQHKRVLVDEKLKGHVENWLSSGFEVPYSKMQLKGLRDDIQTMLQPDNVAEVASFGARRIAQMLVDARSRLGAHPEVQDLLRYVQVWGAPAQPG